jgi:hypothetical protein
MTTLFILGSQSRVYTSRGPACPPPSPSSPID